MKIFGKEFAPQELLLGACANSILIWIVPGDIAVPAIACSSVLWMLGGTFNKAIRRFGVPVVCALSVGAHGWYLAAPVIGVIWLYQGDGFPDHRPTTADAGSWLGRFVEKFVPQDEVGGPLTKYIACLVYIWTTMIYYFL
jgi:hypothetical protein